MQDINGCKIRATDPKHSEAIRAKIDSLGYSQITDLVADLRKPYLIFYKNGWEFSYLDNESTFEDSSYKEIFFYNGDFHDTPEEPPLGICPREIYWSKVTSGRYTELLAAMKRYSKEGKTIPEEWVLELEDLIAEKLECLHK